MKISGNLQGYEVDPKPGLLLKIAFRNFYKFSSPEIHFIKKHLKIVN